jgi:undecaprenyl-diphosphatase
MERINHDVLSWFVGHRADWLNGIMNTLTGIGSSKYVIYPLAVVVGVGFSLWYDNPLPMVLSVATVLGVKTLQHYLIDIVHGPFPPHATAIGPTGSYPSGGTARVVAMFGMAAFLFAVRRPHRRRTAVALFTIVSLLVLAEGFSRLYLGRHWLWDVVGGLLVGALWLGILAFGARVLFRFDAPRRGHPSAGRAVPVEVREPADGARV